MKIEKINELFARFAGQLLRMRWMTLAIFTLVLVLSVIGMKRMVKETSFDDYFIEDDPMLVMTDEFKSHFGNDYYVGVLTQCDNHFTKENLTTLRALSNELMDSLSYADKVTSLTDIEFMVGSDDGMTIEQIVPEDIPKVLKHSHRSGPSSSSSSSSSPLAPSPSVLFQDLINVINRIDYGITEIIF